MLERVIKSFLTAEDFYNDLTTVFCLVVGLSVVFLAAWDRREPERETCYFDRLPPEVLLHVVHLLKEQCLNDAEEQEWLRYFPKYNWVTPLRQVCKRWKDIVDTDPPIWTSLDSRMLPATTRSLLARSGQLPLKVDVTLPGANELPELNVFAEIVEPAWNRITRLHLDLPRSPRDPQIDAAFLSLLSRPAPVVKELQILTDIYSGFNLVPFNGDAPQLRDLRLTCINVTWIPFAQQLITLHVWLMVGEDHVSNLMNALPSCTLLENLCISNVLDVRPYGPHAEAIRLTRLKNLELDFFGVDAAIRIMKSLPMPQLGLTLYFCGETHSRPEVTELTARYFAETRSTDFSKLRLAHHERLWSGIQMGYLRVSFAYDKRIKNFSFVFGTLRAVLASLPPEIRTSIVTLRSALFDSTTVESEDFLHSVHQYLPQVQTLEVFLEDYPNHNHLLHFAPRFGPPTLPFPRLTSIRFADGPLFSSAASYVTTSHILKLVKNRIAAAAKKGQVSALQTIEGKIHLLDLEALESLRRLIPNVDLHKSTRVLVKSRLFWLP